MQKKEVKRVKGVVLEALPGATFKVRLEEGKEIHTYLSGKMRLHHIKVLPGDKVVVEMTEYDDKKGRIVHRL